MTGMRARETTVSMRPFPPRGMMRSSHWSMPAMAATDFAVGEGDELDGVLGKAGFFPAGIEGGGDGAVRVDGLGAAAQNGGVAGFKTKGGGVGGDVGAAFVDDADGADGDADLLDADAVGAVPVIEDLADRIGKGGDVFQGGGDGFESRLVEPQAVEHGGGEAFCFAGEDVLVVFGDDFRGGVAETLAPWRREWRSSFPW